MDIIIKRIVSSILGCCTSVLVVCSFWYLIFDTFDFSFDGLTFPVLIPYFLIIFSSGFYVGGLISGVLQPLCRTTKVSALVSSSGWCTLPLFQWGSLGALFAIILIFISWAGCLHGAKFKIFCVDFYGESARRSGAVCRNNDENKEKGSE